MALSVTHSTVVVVPDDGSSPVGSDEWNATHTISGILPASNLEAAGNTSEIQYNLADAFAADPNFTWVAASGLTDKKHAAFGNEAVIDAATFAAGDPTNEAADAASSVLVINEYFTGDIGGTFPNGAANGIQINTSYKETGVTGSSFLAPLKINSAVNSDNEEYYFAFIGANVNVKDFGSGGGDYMLALNFVATYDGAGDLFTLSGVQGQAAHTGAGTVDGMWGLTVAANTASGSTTNTQTGVEIFNALAGTIGTAYGLQMTAVGGGTVTNLVGVNIEDHSGIGSSISRNIHSKGAASTNVFDGTVSVGALIRPITDDVVDLGSGTFRFKDLYLGSVINFGNGDVTVTHTSNNLDVAGGTLSVGSQAVLTAATGQPLDADLTAIAALSTTAAGRSVLTIADPGVDRIVAWDDSDGAMEAIALADLTDEAAPAAGDYVLLYGAEGDLRKANWSTLPGVGSGIANVVEDTSPTLGGHLEGASFTVGTTGSGIEGLHIEAGGAINWANGEVTITETDANTLTVAGGTFTGASVAAATDTTRGTVELAIQSEMVTGTDTERAVTPAMAHHHSSAAKFWVRATQSSTTMQQSYNVASVEDTAAGRMTVVIAVDFAAITYVPFVGAEHNSASGTTQTYQIDAGSIAAGSFIGESWQVDGTEVLTDPSASWMFVGFGALV